MKGYRAIVVFPIIWIFSKLGEHQEISSKNSSLEYAVGAANPNLLEDCCSKVPKYHALDTMENV